MSRLLSACCHAVRAQALALLIMTCAACAVTRDPSGSGAVLIPGTSDIRVASGFAVSPSGRLVLFESTSPLGGKPRWVVLSLRDGLRREIGYSAAAALLAAAGQGPRLANNESPFEPNGKRLHMGGVDNDFSASLVDGQISWEVSPRSSALPERDRSLLLSVQSLGARQVQVVAPEKPARTVAHFEAESLFTTSIDVEGLELSPDGLWLACTVQEHTGSVVSPPRGYLIHLGASIPESPRRLGAPVWKPLHFTTDGRSLFACAKGPRAGLGLYRWDVAARQH